MYIISPLISIILILFGAINISIAIWAFNKRRLSGAIELALFMLSVSIYTFGYAIEIAHTDLESVLIAVKFEYIGIPYMAHFAALFSYKFASGKSLNKYIVGLMLIIPVLSTLLVFIVEQHSFFYIDPKIIDGKFFPVLSFKLGPIYILRIVFQQFISICSILYLILMIFKSDKIKKAQLISLITAQLIPSIILVFYILKIIPGDLDINPFSAFIVGGIYTVAILKLRLFEIVPHGREVALDAIGEAFILLNKNGEVKDFNNASKVLNFISLECGQRLPEDSLFAKELNKAISNNISSFEYRYTNEKNLLSYFKVNISNIKNSFNKINGKAIIINNITDVMELMEKLEYRATYDYLTGLRNRGFIIDSGIREIERTNRTREPLTFIMIDIDKFKNINDTYGHKVGDEVLILLSQKLSKLLRNIDIIGRYGGEEFLIICPNTSKDNGVITSERLRKEVTLLEIKIDSNTITTSCSFGIHTYDGSENKSIDKIIELADRALYHSKERG